MPTPDPIAVLTALVEQNGVKLDQLIARGTATGNTTTPPPPDDAAAFIAKYTPDDPATFKSKYGVDPGQPLQALVAPFSEDAVVGYAKNGYNTLGQFRNGPTKSQGETIPDYISQIAHMEKTYYTGDGAVDADICAIGFRSGIFVSEQMAYMFGTGYGPQNPKGFLNKPLPFFLNYLAQAGQAGG